MHVFLGKLNRYIYPLKYLILPTSVLDITQNHRFKFLLKGHCCVLFQCLLTWLQGRSASSRWLRTSTSPSSSASPAAGSRPSSTASCSPCSGSLQLHFLVHMQACFHACIEQIIGHHNAQATLVLISSFIYYLQTLELTLACFLWLWLTWAGRWWRWTPASRTSPTSTSQFISMATERMFC